MNHTVNKRVVVLVSAQRNLTAELINAVDIGKVELFAEFAVFALIRLWYMVSR